MNERALDWLGARTFHHQQFEAVSELVRLKEKESLRLSVCIPTMNEAGTVGAIIREIRGELMEKHPLVDQLAVIDSRSTDGTAFIASREGAEIFFDDEILPGLGKATGKGEALWKSLFVLDGDLVIWVDSDIKNFHPRFVYGIAGPLLRHPEIGFVKAFYRRPIQSGGSLEASGGGRVTELTVRPMLNLFYPDLSCLIQPLSGEYGGRREILENIPFFTGYGVEIGMILDIYHSYGLEVFAQVNLEERVHENQPLDELSKMSFAILKTMFKRIKRDWGIKTSVDQVELYNTFVLKDGDFELRPESVRVIERPPMIIVGAYRRARGIEPS